MDHSIKLRKPVMVAQADKPTCKVRGMLQKGAMCGFVIVGGKNCGFSGDCEHKSYADMIVAKVQADAAERSGGA